MKTTFIVSLLLLANVVCAQHPNLAQMPKKERDSLLVKIANEAINRFTAGYLLPGAIPTIEEYPSKNYYTVSYPAPEKEKAFFKREYRIKTIILADIAKVTEIKYVDDVYGLRRIGLERVTTPDEKIVKREFITLEERVREREKARTVTRLLPPPDPKMVEKIRKIREIQQRRQDSGRILRQQYLRKQDSIWKQDSLRHVRQQDSIKNVQSKDRNTDS